MKEEKVLKLISLLSVFVFAGCVVRTYEMTRDRVDQDLSGNRGYLEGRQPSEEGVERKQTRTSKVVEVEFHSPIKFERRPKQVVTEETSAVRREPSADWGNRGYITESYTPPIIERAAPMSEEVLERYTVKSGDTLEKISKKFYGTTKNWRKIYEANKDTLKGPDRIYAGQVINVPTQGGLIEPRENLK